MSKLRDCPVLAGDCRQHFVILAMQSTGSNMLRSALQSHPRTVALGELYLRATTDEGAARNLDILADLPPWYRLPAMRKYLPLTYLERVARARPGGDFFGFKLMLRQCDRLLTRLVRAPDWKRIVIERPNQLAAYSSRMTAHHSGVGTLPKGAVRPRSRIRFDAADFERFLDYRTVRMQNLIRLLEEHSADYCRVSYPHLVGQKTLRRVFDYLGYDASFEASISTAKRNSDDILGRFTNPDEVARYLDRCGRSEWAAEGATEA